MDPMNTMSAETLALLKSTLGTPSEDLAKTISTATGLVAFDLQAPAKNLYPVVTPIRNSIPRVGGGTGLATNWRQISAIIGSGFDAMPWVPEGQRSAQMSYTTASKAASYVTIGEEDAITYEAINAARSFEDLQATMTFRLLQKMMLKEELAILGGNATLALGTPGTPSLSASGSGGTLPALSPYSVIVVALTLEGYFNSSLTAGVATTKTITGADNLTFVLNGGSSAQSASGTQNVSSGQTLFASVTAIQGAVAYAWFVGAVGAERLQAITTINSASFSAALSATSQLASSLPGGDLSTNANYAFDGLLTTALKSASNAYVNIMATGTAGTGTPLTASGRGSVVEIDTMLQTMWNNFELSPTVLYVNAQELKNITTKVLSNSSGPLLRYEPGTQGYELTASGYVSFYFNPFVAQGGGIKIPIRLHPRVPAGTILGWCENLPLQYQSNEVPNVAEVKTRQDYYQIDWPIITRKRQVGVYAEEVLAVYAPFAMGVITNIANG